MTRDQKIIAAVSVVAIFAVAAAATAYIQKDATPTNVAEKPLPWKESKTAKTTSAQPQQQVAQKQPECNDGNVVGTVIGGVAGGVLGSQVGSGKGKTAATIGGTMGGAYLGNQHIPTQNALCK